ncbi:MAG: RagB/SusD family nutrient uptake outer membrane protein, partial [Flavobacteriales bacterium]|nr:RagB/SusD family nutrient uptake outer membrane protein [Flavobacteriales bacterium]
MKRKIFLPIILIAVLLTGCTKFLERTPLDSYDDSNFWLNESNVRQHANYYYGSFFPGYHQGWSMAQMWFRDIYGNDQTTYSDGQPGSFPSTATSAGYSLPSHSIGNGWADMSWSDNYAWIRRTNIFIKRLNESSSTKFTDEQLGHWMGIARFFRGMRYADLVWGWGDVPYYGKSTDDMDELCKPRDNRYDVLDSVLADFKYAIANVRAEDGDNTTLNKYAVASVAARLFMRLGLYQHYITAAYQGGNEAKAKEYLQFAMESAALVMNSGKYSISTPYRELFASASLDGNPEVILARTYAIGMVTHALTSYQNYNEGQSNSISAHMIRSYLFWDGKLANETTIIPDAQNPDNYGKLFTMVDNALLANKDPRLEATIKSSRVLSQGNIGAMSAPYSTKGAATRYYVRKMFPRGGEHYTASQAASEVMTKSASNFTNSPVIRYGETLLNWITCKAELAQWGGGAAVTQDDIDNSINKLRHRPISTGDKTAGLTIDPQPNAASDICKHQLADMRLDALPNDLTRDPDVSPLINEIRRERMVELAFEIYRSKDLRAWGKWLPICQRYDQKPGKYCAEGYPAYDGGDKNVGWGLSDNPTGTINQSVQYYKNAPEGNLHQCGAYFELDVLYKLKNDAKAAWDQAVADGKPVEEINLLKYQYNEWNTAWGAFEGQATGSTGGLWCVDQYGVQHHWLKTDGYSDEVLSKMRGWYIVGKHSLLTVT